MIGSRSAGFSVEDAPSTASTNRIENAPVFSSSSAR
jgi:hypothetical protein